MLDPEPLLHNPKGLSFPGIRQRSPSFPRSSAGWFWVAFGLCILLSQSLFAAQTSDKPAPRQPLNWFTLTADEAMKGLPVEFDGTVLCYDLGWGQLYFQTYLGAIYLNPRPFTNRFQVGQRVKIRATTTWDGSATILTNTTAVVEGREPLPTAQQMKVGELTGSAGQWVEVRGRIRVAEASRDRVTLVLNDGIQRCLVYVMQTSATNQFSHLVDAGVKIRGINASRVRDGKLESAILFCPGLDQVIVIAPPSEDHWKIPVTSIDNVLAGRLQGRTNQPIHINGMVNDYQPGKWIGIKDPTGILSAEVIQVDPVVRDQRIDLWGFPCVRSTRLVLEDAWFEIAKKSPLEIPPATTAKPVANSIITSIRQVRALSKAQANEHRTAKVRGILTFVDTEWHLVFLQDEQDAIFLDTAQSDLQSGQIVEVTGQTDGSGFAPQLVDCVTKILGRTNLPAPIKMELQDAANGRLDSRWVEMEGVVRRVSKENGRVSLSLTGRDGRFSATLLDLNANGAPAELIDSLVTIRGVCGSTVNSRGQLSGISLHVPSRGDIDIIDQSPADPFAKPSALISSVATFNPDRLAGRRVKISGIVTMSSPGQDLYLQDASGGIRVLDTGTNIFRAGERLEVLGFPTFQDFSPCLEETIFRRDGMADLPAPRKTTASGILQNGGQDGSRVELEARVIQSYSMAVQGRLLLQDGPIIFTAKLPIAQEPSALPRLDAGSVVKLRGVCVIQKNESGEPAGFRLQIAGSKDVILLKSAPWWTATHTILLLCGVTMAAVFALLWGFLLKRQVLKQTETIRLNQMELLKSSRLAGMAEIATNVLHNVGNVLNSVNISASIVSDKVKESSARNGLSRAVDLMEEHREDLGEFITNHPRGKNLPSFLKQLAERLRAENEMEVQELGLLTGNIEHIKDIVAMQLTLAKVGGNLEKVDLREIMEDALLINAGTFARFGIDVRRVYNPPAGEITVDKHKLLQILVNLISNARNACMESGKPQKVITLRLDLKDNKVRMSVQDNGLGIAPENRASIFNHGFTTRKDGHGFGLHSGAIAAKQMGGQLFVESAGVGCGACFTLELPLDQTSKPNGHENPDNEK